MAYNNVPSMPQIHDGYWNQYGNDHYTSLSSEEAFPSGFPYQEELFSTNIFPPYSTEEVLSTTEQDEGGPAMEALDLGELCGSICNGYDLNCFDTSSNNGDFPGLKNMEEDIYNQKREHFEQNNRCRGGSDYDPFDYRFWFAHGGVEDSYNYSRQEEDTPMYGDCFSDMGKLDSILGYWPCLLSTMK